jgi:hypothetical protein
MGYHGHHEDKDKPAMGTPPPPPPSDAWQRHKEKIKRQIKAKADQQINARSRVSWVKGQELL